MIVRTFVLQIGTKILTANTERVTGDPRVSIIHEEGGEVRPDDNDDNDDDDVVRCMSS